MSNIYDDALLSQAACNLGGLVHGFDRVITQLQQEAREHGHGTDWIAKHPVCVLFAEQLYHLTGYGRSYSAAIRECEARRTGNARDAIAAEHQSEREAVEITLIRPGREPVYLRTSLDHPGKLVLIGLAGLPHGSLVGFDAENRARFRRWLDAQEPTA